MSFFKKTNSTNTPILKTVIVTGLEVAPANTGKNGMIISYVQKDEHGNWGEKIKRYNDYFNVPYCRVYLKEGENCQKEVNRWAENIKQHLVESYWKFFSVWYEREEFNKVVEFCYQSFKHLLYNPQATKEDINTFRTNLQLFITCLAEQFVSPLNLDEFPSQEVFFFAGVDSKGYYKPCKPSQIQLITRYTITESEGKKKYDYKVLNRAEPHYIDFNPTLFNAQYPFQKEGHSFDVIGFVAKTITNPNGYDNDRNNNWMSNIPKGECSKFTFDFLNKERIFTKKEYDAFVAATSVNINDSNDDLPFSNVSNLNDTVDTENF